MTKNQPKYITLIRTIVLLINISIPYKYYTLNYSLSVMGFVDSMFVDFLTSFVLDEDRSELRFLFLIRAFEK